LGKFIFPVPSLTRGRKTQTVQLDQAIVKSFAVLLQATGVGKWIHYNLFDRETNFVYLNTSSIL